MSTELATAADSILARVDRLVSESRAVVEAAMKAPDLPRDAMGRVSDVPPAGVSMREWNIAVDANKSGRNAPVYLTEAFKMHETAMKIAAGLGDTGDKRLVNTVVHLVVPRQYERVKTKVIDVDAVEKE